MKVFTKSQIYVPASLSYLSTEVPDLMAVYCKPICGHEKVACYYITVGTFMKNTCLIKNDISLCSHITNVPLSLM